MGKQRRRQQLRQALATARAFDNSGLMRREFAARRGISVATLDNYRRRARAVSGLVEVAVDAPAPGTTVGLTLVLRNGRRIEVGEGFSPSSLEQLLAVAEPR